MGVNWAAGVKVEVRKNMIFIEKIKGRTRFEDRYNNCSPSMAPEMFVDIS